MESLPRLLCSCRSTIFDKRYHYRGNSRQDSDLIFQYTLTGCGRFEDPNGSYPLPPGWAFIVRANNPVYTYYYPPSRRDHWTVLWCMIAPGSFSAFFEEMTARHGHVYPIPKESPIIRDLLGFEHADTVSCSLTASRGAELVSNLLYAMMAGGEKQKSNTSQEYLIERATRMINEHPETLFTATQLSRRLNISREHLSRLFKHRLKTTPYTYILKNKIEAAKLNLRTNPLSLKQIAHRLGFSSPQQFSAVFKKATNLSPRQFRRQKFQPTQKAG
jgi:AraC-like DNA-binding protein